jgi:hypothetical protein
MFLIPISYEELEKLQIERVDIPFNKIDAFTQEKIIYAMRAVIQYESVPQAHNIPGMRTFSDRSNLLRMELEMSARLASLNLPFEYSFPSVKRRDDYEYDIDVRFYRKGISLKKLMKIPETIRKP